MYKKVIGIWFMIFLSLDFTCYSMGIQNNQYLDSSMIRIEFLNDAFFNKDNKISSSWSIQWHSMTSRNWNDLKEVPGFVKKLGRDLPTLNSPTLYHRVSLGIGQLIQTPNDLSRKDLIKNDVPYAGIIGLLGSWYTYDNVDFRGLQVVLGVVGPLSLAEQTQKTVHRKNPRGWTHQLHTEPILNLNYMIKKKVFQVQGARDLALDLSVGGETGLGNLFTQASILSVMRFGFNMPQGFSYNPDPIGFGVNYDANLSPKEPNKPSIFFSIGARGSGFLRNLLFDGNTFRKSHRIDKKDFVLQLFGGINFIWGRLGFHFWLTVTTDDVDISNNYRGADNERFGTVIVEWSF